MSGSRTLHLKTECVMSSNGSNGNGGGNGNFINPKIPSIPLTQVYEKTNPRGRRYMVGRIGTVKLLVIATDQVDRGDPVWQVYVGQGPYPPDGAAELAREVECVRPPDSEKQRMSGVE